MKKVVIIIVLAIVGGILTYNYIYQDHRDVENEKAEFSLTAKALINNFLIAPEDSEKKYLNKTIEVTGTISEVNEQDLILNNVIFCQFNNTVNQSIKANIKVKGRFIGYDDLLEQVKLDQCTITHEN